MADLHVVVDTWSFERAKALFTARKTESIPGSVPPYPSAAFSLISMGKHSQARYH